MARKKTAIVIGGSIGGSLAAAGLSEHFDEVIVFDRDVLPDDPQPRKGTPQARQTHLELPMGMAKSMELLPGLDEQLAAAGCPTIDFCRDLAVVGPTGEAWQVRAASGVGMTCLTRPLFENVVRRNVKAIPNVEYRQGSIEGLATTDDRSTVTGVQLRTSASDVVSADLVVDCGGRGSKSPKWLKALDFEPPPEQRVHCFMGYSSRLVRIPDGLLPDDGLQGVGAQVSPPHNTRGGVFLPVENGRHMLLAAGMAKDYPPGDHESLRAFFRDVSSPLISEYAEQFEPVTEWATYHIPSNQRRLWEDMDRAPENFVALGDAVASFNPIYAQGMTQAALHAVVLREQLAARNGDGLTGFRADFQEALRPFNDHAFTKAAMADTGYPGVEFENYEPQSPENLEYLMDLTSLCTQDASVSVAFMQSIGYMDSAPLEAPEVQEKVGEWVAAGRPITKNTDLTKLPGVESVSVPA